MDHFTMYLQSLRCLSSLNFGVPSPVCKGNTRRRWGRPCVAYGNRREQGNFPSSPPSKMIFVKLSLDDSTSTYCRKFSKGSRTMLSMHNVVAARLSRTDMREDSRVKQETNRNFQGIWREEGSWRSDFSRLIESFGPTNCMLSSLWL